MAACPTIVISPGETLPANWGMQVILTGVMDLTHPMPFGTSGNVTLKCAGGNTIPLTTITPWNAITLAVQLPPASPPGCNAPYQLVVHIVPVAGAAIDCPVSIKIADLTVLDLKALACMFTIMVGAPSGLKPLDVGTPLPARIVPPAGTALNFIDLNGQPIPGPKAISSEALTLQALSAELVAASGSRRPGSLGSNRDRVGSTGAAAAAVRRHATVYRIAERVLEGEATRWQQNRSQWRVPHLAPPSPNDVTVEVEWRVEGLALLFFQSFNVEEGKLFSLSDPNTTLNSPAIGLLFRPWVTSATDPPTPPLIPAVYFLYAKVKLTALGQSADCELGPIPLLQIPVLELPSVLAVFRDTAYQGKVLVCVPANGVVGSTPVSAASVGLLRQTLSKLQNLLGKINTLVGVAEWITGLSTLTAATASADGDKLAVSDVSGVVNLEDSIIEHNWYGDYDWGDEASSAILVGAPDQTVAFYSYYDAGDVGRFYWNYGGEFQLSTDWDLNVRVPSFVTNPPVDETNKPNKVLVPDPNDDNFNDAVSKIRFFT